MNVRWERFFSLRFDGERFRDAASTAGKRTPGLDLRDLEELIAVREAIFDLAEFVWRRNNPKLKNLPAHFRKQIDVRIFEVEPGSSIFPFERPIDLDTGPASRVRRRTEELPEAAHILTASWSAAIKDEQPPYALPDLIVDKIKAIGSTRTPNEIVDIETFMPTVHEQTLRLFVEDPVESIKATLDSTAREKGERNLDAFKVAAAHGLAQIIEQDDYEVVGDVIEADRRTKSAQLQLNGRPIPIKLSPSQLHDVTLALHKDLDFRLHIIGKVLLDAATGRVLRIKEASVVRCIPKPAQLSLFSWSIDPVDELPSGEVLDSSTHGAIKESLLGLHTDINAPILSTVRGEDIRDAHDDSAEVVKPTWSGPCEEMFEYLAEHDPYALIELIKGGTLRPGHLTYAAEAAGTITDRDLVVPVLVSLLAHSSPLVREGAVYGLAQHTDPSVSAALRDVAANDPVSGVREAAESVLEEST
ncbi:MAG: HEAT repeat domain-containing protein [Polyangiaceae bacterium]|nr:HEAT repeat domain-containing protein [Polyangiaceae bacterium]